MSPWSCDGACFQRSAVVRCKTAGSAATPPNLSLSNHPLQATESHTPALRFWRPLVRPDRARTCRAGARRQFLQRRQLRPVQVRYRVPRLPGPLGGLNFLAPDSCSTYKSSPWTAFLRTRSGSESRTIVLCLGRRLPDGAVSVIADPRRPPCMPSYGACHLLAIP